MYFGIFLSGNSHLVHLQLRTFRGHTNEKNFVGLTVNREYIACGSETNDVYVYHKVSNTTTYDICILFIFVLKQTKEWVFSKKNFFVQEIAKPLTWHRFGSQDMDDADEDAGAGSHFISAVCWKSDSPTMLTANSQGTIKVLVLAA